MPGMIEKAVLTAVEVVCTSYRFGLPPCRSREARACLFECQERSAKQFSPLLRSCEAGAGQFKWQERSVYEHERSRKQF